MNGRLESEILIKNNIISIINGMPQTMQDDVLSYYYNIKTSKEPTTCRAYIQKLNNLVKYCVENNILYFRDVDDLVIAKYFDEKSCIVTDGNIRKSSDSHKRTMWSAFNSFFTYLYKKKLIPDNPIDKIQRPKNNDVIQRKYLSFDDLNLIVKSVKSYYNKEGIRFYDKLFQYRDILIVSLLIVTGMRREALSQMNVEDVSFKDKTITVIDKRNKTQVYKMVPKIEALIKEWLEYREIILDKKECDALFVSRHRKRLCSKEIYIIIKKHSECLGESISPHKIRGAFISLYYEESGHDIEATRKAVGHNSVTTTSRYISTKNDSRENAINFMSDNLSM